MSNVTHSQRTRWPRPCGCTETFWCATHLSHGVRVLAPQVAGVKCICGRDELNDEPSSEDSGLVLQSRRANICPKHDGQLEEVVQ